ncbi:MAG: methylthioribulose 1-phosphate dehydratase [Wenzhouxiangellaceae bacterium]|nr:methylthioribulose 1-phosphate dehydratase [Wenzhouxiangellaceae bacterium]
MPTSPPHAAESIGDESTVAELDELVETAREFGRRGWTPATSGNYSVRHGETIWITRSGLDKRRLTRDGLMPIDRDGQSADGARPSAETGLHLQLYRRFAGIHAVLHVHSPMATMLSRRVDAPGAIAFEGLELLKALPGISSHEARIELPVVANDQDMTRLAASVEPWLDRAPAGYLIAGHGLYAWGARVADAARHLEALEFLLQLHWMEQQ